MHAEINTHPGGGATIKIDGTDISHAVRSYQLDHDDPRAAPVLTIDMPITEIASYTGEVRLHMADASRDLLIEHGWTPPEENDQ